VQRAAAAYGDTKPVFSLEEASSRDDLGGMPLPQC